MQYNYHLLIINTKTKLRKTILHIISSYLHCTQILKNYRKRKYGITRTSNSNSPEQLTLVSHSCVSITEPKQTPPLDAPVQLRVPTN
jgi:hypothetical protein